MFGRKEFLSVLSATGTVISFAASAPASPAESTPAAPASPPPAKVSDSARARALAMRRFDATLEDEQIDAIARGIDDAESAGPLLNPRGSPLANGDEPVTHFVLPEPKVRA